MLARLTDLPFIVVLLGISAVAMFVPAAHALAIDDHQTSRSFFYAGILFLVLFIMIALATSNYRIRRQGRSHLISILMALVLMPLATWRKRSKAKKTS